MKPLEESEAQALAKRAIAAATPLRVEAVPAYVTDSAPVVTRAREVLREGGWTSRLEKRGNRTVLVAAKKK